MDKYTRPKINFENLKAMSSCIQDAGNHLQSYDEEMVIKKDVLKDQMAKISKFSGDNSDSEEDEYEETSPVPIKNNIKKISEILTTSTSDDEHNFHDSPSPDDSDYNQGGNVINYHPKYVKKHKPLIQDSTARLLNFLTENKVIAGFEMKGEEDTFAIKLNPSIWPKSVVYPASDSASSSPLNPEEGCSYKMGETRAQKDETGIFKIPKGSSSPNQMLDQNEMPEGPWGDHFTYNYMSLFGKKISVKTKNTCMKCPLETRANPKVFLVHLKRVHANKVPIIRSLVSVYNRK